jgi:5-methylcytosine-specific restriction endonuclease McrA
MSAISKKKRQRCYARDNYRCVKCGTHKRLTCDHVIPKSLGGPDWLCNLQTLCVECNFEKANSIIQYTTHPKTTKIVRRFNEAI